MNEQGLKGTPVWKQLVSSLFSWQTAMVAGVTILSMYGKDIAKFVSNLSGMNTEIKNAADIQKDLSETWNLGAKNAQEELVQLELLYETASKTNNSLKERNDALKSIQEISDKYIKDLGEEKVSTENLGKVYGILKTRILEAASARAAFDKIVENNKQILDLQKELKKSIDDSSGFWQWMQKNVPLLGKNVLLFGLNIQYLSNKAKDTQEAIRGLNEENEKLKNGINVSDLFGDLSSGNEAEDYAKYMLDIEKQITDATINAITDRKEREIAEINAEYDEKEAAIKGNSEKETQLRALLTEERARKIKEKETEYERDIRETNLNNMMAYEKEGSDAMMAYRIELLELQREKEVEEAEKTGASVLEVNRKYDAMIKKEKEEMASQKADKIMADNASISFLDGHALNKQMRELSEAYKNGNISKEQYEAENYRIQQEYAQKQIQSSIDTIKSILNNEKLDLSDDDRIRYEEQLAQAQMDLDNMVTDNKIENDKRQVESEKEKRQKQMELMQQVSSLLGSLGEFGDQLFQNKIDQLDEENEANQEAYDKEIENIEKLEESGAISTEEAEARKRAAEDKTKAKEEEIAKRKAELQRKQAIYDKAMSIAQVGISTALGIMRTIGQLGLPAAAPFVALVAAMGAVQLATILATPIPKYKEGTDYHKGGLAIVGDGGVPETVLTPDGKLYLTPAFPTLTELPIGTKVFPENIYEDEDKYVRSDALTLMDMRDGDGLPIVMVQNDYSGLERRIDKLERSMLKAFEEAKKESKKARYEAFKSRI